tara:strand:+ start:530 stop:868 length:339 start_codon:yes stop_codon:yes gene_type:complete
MGKPTKSDILKKEVIKALEKTLGVVTTACKQVGIARSTFYDWYNNDLVFQKDVDDMKAVALDFAESKLFEQINDNIPTSTIFYLKTQGKKRGYVEGQELTINTGNEKPSWLE